MTNTTEYTITDLSGNDLDILDIAQFPDEYDFTSFDDAFDDLLRSENEKMDKTE
jgi:hypothetical protein